MPLGQDKKYCMFSACFSCFGIPKNRIRLRHGGCMVLMRDCWCQRNPTNVATRSGWCYAITGGGARVGGFDHAGIIVQWGRWEISLRDGGHNHIRRLMQLRKWLKTYDTLWYVRRFWSLFQSSWFTSLIAWVLEKQHICKQQKVSLCLRSSFHKVQPGIFGGILTHCC